MNSYTLWALPLKSMIAEKALTLSVAFDLKRKEGRGKVKVS